MHGVEGKPSSPQRSPSEKLFRRLQTFCFDTCSSGSILASSQGVVVQGGAHEQHRSEIRWENLLLPRSARIYAVAAKPFAIRILRLWKASAAFSFAALTKPFAFRSKEPEQVSIRRLIIFSGSISHEQLIRQWRRKEKIFEMICKPSVANEGCSGLSPRR